MRDLSMSWTKKPKATKKPAAKKTSEKKRPSTVPRKPDGTIDWRRYNEALKERGNVIFWIEKEKLERWLENPGVNTQGGKYELWYRRRRSQLFIESFI